MEGGPVPRRRRSVPRTLLGPPPTGSARRRTLMPTAQGSQEGATVTVSSSSDRTSQDEDVIELQQALRYEQAERERLQNTLKEEVAKSERSMRQQTQLEEELVSKDAIIDGLSSELRLLKQKKQSADSELAQSTADYLNSQAKWLEQVDGLNDEVQALKSKLLRSQEDLGLAKKELAAYKEKEAKDEAEKRRRDYKAAHPDNVQVAADALEKHQNELLIKELRAYHGKLRDEIQEIKEMNERLKEDNEHYQYLLVENTITGNLPDIQQMDLSQSSLGNASSRGDNANTEDNGDGDTSSGGTDRDDDVSLCRDQRNGLGLTLADDEVMYDLKSMNKEPSLEEQGSITSVDSSESLQKVVNRQQFELRSLQNYNRALKLSLERLVDRLLDNKTFSRAVEESVSQNSVRQFRSRVASYSEDSMPPAATKAPSITASSPVSSQRRASNTLSPNSANSASMWSNMIFNSQYTGAPSRRVVSLGVDNEFKPPPPPSPLASQGSGGTSASTSTIGDSQSGVSTPIRPRITPMRYAFGHPKASHSPASSSSSEFPSSSSEINVSKRTDSLTGIRKLRLA